MEGVTAMDNAEPYELTTVLLRLEGLKGMAREIGLHPPDDLGGAAAKVERTGLLRKMLASLRLWEIVPGK
jgi:hypothetical protein